MTNATMTKFGYPATRIAETAWWSAQVRPKQPTLGSLVLVCREPVGSFAEVSAEAYADLRGMVADIERVLGEFVAYERINYLMLMMVDPDVHFHVIPRYAEPRGFDGRSFADAGWPGPPALGEGVDLDAQTSAALVARLAALWDAR